MAYQSELGEGEGVAEELAQAQRSISIAEFFEKNKQMLGFDSGAKALVTAVKEAVDNALDATEEAGILPDIYVEIEDRGDYYRLVVEDNGPGITREQVPKVFGKLLYGSRFHKREQSLTPAQQILVKRDGQVDFRPIGGLCDAYLPAQGEATVQIPDSIEVPCFNRDSKGMTWQPVTHALRHETSESTYKITTEIGRTVEVTGNHSLFRVTADGHTDEVEASSLETGDAVLAPRALPEFDDQVTEVNLLKQYRRSQLEDRDWDVYGFDEETLAELRTGDTVRQNPSPDSPQTRCYYQYNGVEIRRDSLEQDYIPKGYLPAEIVLALGWEDRARECELRTNGIGGVQTSIPVTLPLSDSVMEMTAHYISAGHVGDRQVGITVGSHEPDRIETPETAVEATGGTVTTGERAGNSTQGNAFESALRLFLKNTCGNSAQTKRIPEFVFKVAPELQRRFIAALYQEDESNADPSVELSHTTTSQTLARQLSVLWNMQGVLASSETIEQRGEHADDSATAYRTKVLGSAVDDIDEFSIDRPLGEQRHTRVPVSVLDSVRVDESVTETVPETIPGLILGAGIGSNLEHATVYQSVIEDTLNGKTVEKPRYVHDLKSMRLLDADHQPTDRLRTLWSSIQQLQGISDTDMCLLQVTDVSETEPPDYVYDLSVPGETGYDENFVVANEGAISVRNSRGQQGIGISAAVLYSQLTSGKPAKITAKTASGDSRYFELTIDTDSNEPEIDVDQDATWERPHGTRIELEMEGNLRARQQLHDYVKHTAVVNPHARLTFVEPKLDDPLVYERATDELPDETEEIRPHPHGIELGTLRKMIDATDSYSVSGFVQGEFTRVGGKTARTIVDNFRDRHFGREMAWRVPQVSDESNIEAAVTEAVVNKGRQATATFAGDVDNALSGLVTHGDVVDAVAAAADAVEADHDTRFGATVRENAVAAAWDAVTASRRAELYTVVDEVTTTRKDDAAIDGLALRLKNRIEQAAEDDPRDRVRRDALEDWVAKAARDVKEEYDESFGETAQEKVVSGLWDRAKTVADDPPKISQIRDDRDIAAELHEAMRETDILAPPTDCLAPINAELLEAGLRKEYDADFYATSTRDADVHRGDPFIVEAGVAYGGDIDPEGNVDILRFANRVPLVYRLGACATTDVLKGINWRNYGLDQPGGSGMPGGPAVIMVHIASTNVPFTSESKDAVANVPAIEDEIELALREVGRELKSYLSRQRSLAKRREKQNVIAEILPEMAAKLSEVTGREPLNIDDSLARIMNNVLVERRVEDGTVELAVRNYGDRNTSPQITDIVSEDPGDVEGATVVEMDGEWFVKWAPTVEGGSYETIEYSVSNDAEFDVSVEGIEGEKLTVNA